MFHSLRRSLRSRRPSRRQRAGIPFGEVFEVRTLLAGNVSAILVGGELNIVGDSAANSVEVTVEGENLVVRGLDDTTINGSADDFVIATGSTQLEANVNINLGVGTDTFRLTGPLTVVGNLRSNDPQAGGSFGITDATVSGGVRILSNSGNDDVSLVSASIGGNLFIDLDRGTNLISLRDTTVGGDVEFRTGRDRDTIVLDGSTVGALTMETGNNWDSIVLQDSTVNGDFYASTGDGNDFIRMADTTVTGDLTALLWFDNDYFLTEGTNSIGGDLTLGGFFGKWDTAQISAGTSVGGNSWLAFFEFSVTNDQVATDARVDALLDVARLAQARINRLDIGDLSLTVDTSNNVNTFDIPDTLVVKDDTLNIQGTTLAGATVSVTAAGDTLDLGDVRAGADGTYSIDVSLLEGATTLKVTTTDFLDRTMSEEFDIDRITGTLVQFDSSEGLFYIELFDDAAPLTVSNFIGYSNRYENSIVHRTARDSTSGVDVIQGGSFVLDSANDLERIVTDAPVTSEASLDRSNVRGTIAMALPSDGFGNVLVDQGTSQWFVNVNDNVQLDTDGFTVFGEVIGNGMDIVDAIFAVPEFDINDLISTSGGALGQTPLTNYTEEQILLQGTVSVDLGSIAVTGTGTQFTTEVSVGDTVFFDNQSFLVDNIDSDTQLSIRTAPTADIVDAELFSDFLPVATPTRDQYVEFESILGIL